MWQSEAQPNSDASCLLQKFILGELWLVVHEREQIVFEDGHKLQCKRLQMEDWLRPPMDSSLLRIGSAVLFQKQKGKRSQGQKVVNGWNGVKVRNAQRGR